MRPVGAPETDAYQECVNAQLLSLRTDFGRDLTRLSATERRRIDAICSKFSSATEREAYVECLNDQLVSLHNRRSRANPDVPAGAPLPPPSASTPSTSPAPLARASSRRLGLWIGGALVTVVVAASGVFLALRARRAPRKCKVCGQDVSDSGELCPACRREAAEVLRRAAAERADQQRAQEEEQRRQKEDEEERRRHKARQAEEARLRELEQAREAERARDEEEVRRPEQEAARATEQHQTDLTVGEVFDPYAILGVPRDASKEAIRAAYEEAKSKYDSDLVSSLGADVQEYFKAKAQAVERAYQQLTQ
jgi:flagellar biosynthesis GTPase FlhF